MSNTLGKNLYHLCFSKVKRPQPQITSPPKQNISNHPLSPTSPITTFTKNYNSLFEDITCLAPTTSASSMSVSDDAETDTDQAVLETQTPDLTAAYASRRFFISSPGRSNSIVDYRSSSSSLEEETCTPTAAAIAGGVPVETYSPDPYVDFRRSMQEMMEAHEAARESVMGAWEYLQELLLSYLTLNPKSTHKYIVRAFADVVVSSMSPIIIGSNNNGATSSSSSPSFSSYCGVTNCSNNNYVEIFNNAT